MYKMASRYMAKLVGRTNWPVSYTHLDVYKRQILGESKVLKESVSLAQKVSVTDVPVLLTGETGTGKEVFAQAIHYSSCLLYTSLCLSRHGEGDGNSRQGYYLEVYIFSCFHNSCS